MCQGDIGINLKKSADKTEGRHLFLRNFPQIIPWFVMISSLFLSMLFLQNAKTLTFKGKYVIILHILFVI